MPVRIREFTDSDQASIDAIQLESQEDLNANVPKGFFDDLSDISNAFKDGAFIVAEVEGKVAGYGGLLSTGEVVRMRVAERYRRKGTATQILNALLKAAEDLGMKKVHLHTLEQQVSAQRLYEVNGFKEVARTHLYGNQVIGYARQLGTRSI